ncbi:hypothetical protein GH714_003816 [Hevea brasiliensis]|uniref:Reverse transcriptase Ty1/copia-type domain-containing protein n=1 Tax=Hevea brasiliensis TaxID=3981 RepID=A0A6A6K3L1_HEVBR|nr:hypothetical protein GH714_003816 [Hevea brasiliensis]
MASCKPCLTPMVTAPPLTKASDKPFENGETYRQVVGALQYLTLTHPNIAFTVNKAFHYSINIAVQAKHCPHKLLQSVCVYESYQIPTKVVSEPG